jgi:HAMP domain-containing protein
VKPTPGPWKASAAGVVSTSTKGASVICEAPIHYLDSAKNWDANAALIAKAPDMQGEIDHLREALARIVEEGKSPFCREVAERALRYEP